MPVTDLLRIYEQYRQDFEYVPDPEENAIRNRVDDIEVRIAAGTLTAADVESAIGRMERFAHLAFIADIAQRYTRLSLLTPLIPAGRVRKLWWDGISLYPTESDDTHSPMTLEDHSSKILLFLKTLEAHPSTRGGFDRQFEISALGMVLERLDVLTDEHLNLWASDIDAIWIKNSFQAIPLILDRLENDPALDRTEVAVVADRFRTEFRSVLGKIAELNITEHTNGNTVSSFFALAGIAPEPDRIFDRIRAYVRTIPEESDPPRETGLHGNDTRFGYVQSLLARRDVSAAMQVLQQFTDPHLYARAVESILDDCIRRNDTEITRHLLTTYPSFSRMDERHIHIMRTLCSRYFGLHSRTDAVDQGMYLFDLWNSDAEIDKSDSQAFEEYARCAARFPDSPMAASVDRRLGELIDEWNSGRLSDPTDMYSLIKTLLIRRSGNIRPVWNFSALYPAGRELPSLVSFHTPARDLIAIYEANRIMTNVAGPNTEANAIHQEAWDLWPYIQAGLADPAMIDNSISRLERYPYPEELLIAIEAYTRISALDQRLPAGRLRRLWWNAVKDGKHTRFMSHTDSESAYLDGPLDILEFLETLEAAPVPGSGFDRGFELAQVESVLDTVFPPLTDPELDIWRSNIVSATKITRFLTVSEQIQARITADTSLNHDTLNRCRKKHTVLEHTVLSKIAEMNISQKTDSGTVKQFFRYAAGRNDDRLFGQITGFARQAISHPLYKEPDGVLPWIWSNGIRQAYILALLPHGEIDTALEVLRSLDDTDVYLSALYDIMRHCLMSGRTDRLPALFGTFRDIPATFGSEWETDMKDLGYQYMLMFCREAAMEYGLNYFDELSAEGYAYIENDMGLDYLDEYAAIAYRFPGSGIAASVDRRITQLIMLYAMGDRDYAPDLATALLTRRTGLTLPRLTLPTIGTNQNTSSP